MKFLSFVIIVVPIFLFSCNEDLSTKADRKDKDLIKQFKKNRVIKGKEKCKTKKTFYVDKDNDGYGDENSKIEACEFKVGLSKLGGDCDDNDPRVFPNQKSFFSTPRKNGSFDYNCDKKQSVRLITRAYCVVKENKKGCRYASGWDIKNSQKIPSCGKPHSWEWNECKAVIVEKVPEPSDGTPVLDIEKIKNQKPPKISYHCWSGKLKWKKRQLCR
jgi:hypothetical protein